jgi:hypothetical protein
MRDIITGRKRVMTPQISFLIACLCLLLAVHPWGPFSGVFAKEYDSPKTQSGVEDWGEMENGVRTRLVPVDEVFPLGGPMRFRLEMINVGTTTVQYDSQQVDVNSSMLIKGPDGREAPYIEQAVQTVGGPRPLNPGERVVLFENLDISDQYLILTPGKYTVQFRGQGKAFGEVPIPPSNVVRINVSAGRLRPLHEVAGRLIGIAPDENWRVSVIREGEVTPTGRRADRGLHLCLVRWASLKKDVLLAPVWITENEVRVDKGDEPRSREGLSEYLGQCRWGHIYFHPSRNVQEVWPEYAKTVRWGLTRGDDDPLKPPVWRLVEDPVEAIRKALPEDWSILKVEQEVYPWHRLPGKGTAVRLTKGDKKRPKQAFDAVLFIMPADYRDDLTVNPGVAQTNPPVLVVTVEDAKIYLWGGEGEKIKDLLLDAIIEKEEGPAKQPDQME